MPAAIWAEQRQKALAEAKLDVGFEAFGYDIDPAAVALANANAKLAGVESAATLKWLMWPTLPRSRRPSC